LLLSFYLHKIGTEMLNEMNQLELRSNLTILSMESISDFK